jgi:hypothetical protein
MGLSARFRKALSGLIIAVAAGTLTGCVQSPEAQLRSALGDRAELVKDSFAKVLAGHRTIDDLVYTVEHSTVEATINILDWTEADFDSPTLSYPRSALYAVGRTDRQVIIYVVLSSSVSQGGLSSSELIGYSCVKFTGVSGDPPGVLLASVQCPKVMREKSFDGDGYLAVNL